MELNLPQIIFDTDMDTDCDDAGAFAMLLEAYKLKKCNLVCVIADSVCKYSAPCCEYIAKYYGVDLPIGTVFSDNYRDDKNFEKYINHSQNCFDEIRSYNYDFAKNISKIDIDYENCIKVYRKVLSSADDKSITVLCVGMLTAISETLLSMPDEISNLNGVELFRKKVKRVITMGNPYKENDFNWSMDAKSSKVFFNICPTDIYISPEGKDILTGCHLSDTLPEKHPLRIAYETWLQKPSASRSSWDLIASLFAIDEKTSYLKCEDLNDCFYDENTKRLCFKNTNSGKYKIIKLNCDGRILENVLNNYMIGKFEK